MPYSADLRASYCKIQLNIDWFYEAMSEYNVSIECDDDDELAIFHQYIEWKFEKYMIWNTIERITLDDEHHKYENYVNIWDYLYIKINKYNTKRPSSTVKITFDEI
jgi:hypothetical protein